MGLDGCGWGRREERRERRGEIVRIGELGEVEVGDWRGRRDEVERGEESMTHHCTPPPPRKIRKVQVVKRSYDIWGKKKRDGKEKTKETKKREVETHRDDSEYRDEYENDRSTKCGEEKDNSLKHRNELLLDRSSASCVSTTPSKNYLVIFFSPPSPSYPLPTHPHPTQIKPNPPPAKPTTKSEWMGHSSKKTTAKPKELMTPPTSTPSSTSLSTPPSPMTTHTPNRKPNGH